MPIIIFSLSELNNKKLATNINLNLLFVDLTKAYDIVLIQKLWKILEKSPINNTVLSTNQRAERKCNIKGKIQRAL